MWTRELQYLRRSLVDFHQLAGAVFRNYWLSLGEQSSDAPASTPAAAAPSGAECADARAPEEGADEDAQTRWHAELQVRAAMLLTALEDCSEGMGVHLLQITCPELMAVRNAVLAWIAHVEAVDADAEVRTDAAAAVGRVASDARGTHGSGVGGCSGGDAIAVREDVARILALYESALSESENGAACVDRAALLRGLGVAEGRVRIAEDRVALTQLLLVRSCCVLKFCVSLTLLYGAAASEQDADADTAADEDAAAPGKRVEELTTTVAMLSM
jgi:hypothetical protein